MNKQNEGRLTRARASGRALSAALQAAKEAGYEPTKMIVRGAVVEIFFGDAPADDTLIEDMPDVGGRRLKDW